MYDEEEKTRGELLARLRELRSRLLRTGAPGSSCPEKRPGRESIEESIRLSIEGSKVGVWDWDIPTGRVISYNWAEMLGYPPEEIPSHDSMWENSLHPEDRERMLQTLEEHMAGKTPLYESEYRLRAKSGEWRWILGRGKVIERDEAGGPLRAVGIHLDVTERKETEEALRRSEKRCRLLSLKLFRAQEEERRRIARDVHDSFGAALTGIKIHLENQQREFEKKKINSESLKALVAITQKAIRECRRIITDLRPSVLDDYGIAVTVGWLCDEFHGLYPAVQVHKSIDIREEAVPEHLKSVIFRISQEALNNIIRHSKATQVALSLSSNGDLIELTVTDNGIGVDLNQVLSQVGAGIGFGLAGMRERAELAGGQFSIASVPGEGTTIRASWPAEIK